MVFTTCQTKQEPARIDFSPIKNLITLDRSSVRSYDENLDMIFAHKDSTLLTKLQIQAYSFAWGGEIGGPWTRALCFFRSSPERCQLEFLYEGEYAMSTMRDEEAAIKSGENHYLGLQLTKVGHSLGEDIIMDKDRMKELLTGVMENMLECPQIRKSYMDSLDINKPMMERYGHLDLAYLKSAKFRTTLKKIKDEMTINPDPYVVFSHGELTNGIWKGTVRQFDHTGRFCIDLEYLNGEFAYTMWL